MKYVILSTMKGRTITGNTVLLAYGAEGQPAPEMLLSRGGIATMFPTADAAVAALKRTVKQAQIEGHEWPKKCTYEVIELHDAPEVQEAPVQVANTGVKRLGGRQE